MTWAEHNKAVGMFDNVRVSVAFFPGYILYLLSVVQFCFICSQIWFNNKGWASSVSYLNAVNNLILRSSLPERPDRDQFGITAINHPMNYTRNQLEDKIVYDIYHLMSIINFFAKNLICISINEMQAENGLQRLARHCCNILHEFRSCVVRHIPCGRESVQSQTFTVCLRSETFHVLDFHLHVGFGETLN